jgi:hypothetical protein
MEKELYIRHIKNLGFGIIILRDYSMGRDTPNISDNVATLAVNAAVHTLIQRVYKNRGDGPPYAIGHRGIPVMDGFEKIAEFEFIAQN